MTQKLQQESLLSNKRSKNVMKENMTPKKTALIMVTVIGCIAILWPKVFYPMMFGSTAPKATNFKDQRGGPGEVFMNSSLAIQFGPHLYRKQISLYTDEINFRTGIRQERPTHLHPESIYQAMRERGRAIPVTPSVPIVERKSVPSKVTSRDGRPGPGPGMRPPMGAGALHQPQSKGGSMGFVMPLYTIGIVVFFLYTIMKIVFKKPLQNPPYGHVSTDSNFRKEVFGHENGGHVEDLTNMKLGWREHQTRTAKNQVTKSKQLNDKELYHASVSATTIASSLSSSIKQHQQHYHYGQSYPTNADQDIAKTSQLQQTLLPQKVDVKELKSSLSSSPLSSLSTCNKETEQLLEIEKLRKKLEDTERAMAKLIAEMNSDQYEAKNSNEKSTSNHGHTNQEQIKHRELVKTEMCKSEADQPTEDRPRKHRDVSSDRELTVLGMEVTLSCEGGQKWTGRPSTPVLLTCNEHSNLDVNGPKLQSIYLEGSLAHESKILVSDAETKCEEVYDIELNGSPEEPAVVLSSKMTLSLINLDPNQHNDDAITKDIESPLGDDIEIIGHDYTRSQ